MGMQTLATTAVSAQRLPSQIKYIVGNEAAERFSFYGMRSILVVFMSGPLLMAAEDAKASFHLFVSAAYLTPLLGGFIADRFLGKYKTIMALSIVYCLGHLVLAMFESREGMMAGLALIALGAGGIKPCVSAHVGDQFTPVNQHLMKRVYDLFYWSINFGSFFSTLLIPVVYAKYGSGLAFGIPGILMAIATVIFWMGRKQYVHVPPTGKTNRPGFLRVFFSSDKSRFAAEDRDAADAVWGVIKVFATVSIFWALYDQHSASWVLQAQQMTLSFFGMPVEASQIGALNPIMVMVLIPIFAFGVYPLIEKMGVRVTPLRKMGAGMFIAASSFVVVGLYQNLLDAGTQLSVAWHIIPFLLITIAEVMISITGLEFAYTQAPRSAKSTLMSFWLLTIFAGNFLTAIVEKVNVFQGATQFYFFAALMLGVSFIFAYAASRYRERNYMET